MSPSTLPKLMAFDLDDTLAPSKSAVDPRMASLLVRLLKHTSVCIISGGQIGQFRMQVLEHLVPAGAGAEELGRLHLMPTCGTQYFRHSLKTESAGDPWELVYAEVLSEEEKAGALKAVEEEAKRLGYWEKDTWGPILEDRKSQITFSALGQAAPVAAKAAWDADGVKKATLRDAVAALLPGLEVRSGGSTSIDITRKGIDKAYGVRKLVEQTGIKVDDMIFVGDRLDEGGNDYPVIVTGIRTHAVEGWEDTAKYLESYGI